MRRLILTSRFKRSLRKYVKNNQPLKKEIEKTLKQNVVACEWITKLSTSGSFHGSSFNDHFYNQFTAVISIPTKISDIQ